MIEFWFEFASTYSYPAAMRIDAIARQRGIAVAWRPFLLGPIFKEQGWSDSPFNIYPAKGRYMWRDLQRICESLQIPLQRPSQFPRNGVLASRIACAGGDAPWVPEFVRRTYTANFAQDLDILNADVLRDCLDGLVAAPASIIVQAGSDEAKASLRRNTERAAQLGIFGAPSFVVGEELFWGNDRLEAAFDWYRNESTRT